MEKAGSGAKTEDEASWKRKKVLQNFIGEEEKPQGGLFADPAAMFN